MEQYAYYSGAQPKGAQQNGAQYGEVDTHAALRRIEWLAHWMDARWVVPGLGFRVGLDPILGLIPGVGDTIAAAIGAYIIYEAHRLGVPIHLKLRMVTNLAIDWVLGSIPFAGDVFDATFRANLKNAALLRKHLKKRM